MRRLIRQLPMNFGEECAVGDWVTRRPTTFGEEDFSHAGKTYKLHKGGEMRGRVIYIHPTGRYHLVEFVLPGGTIREAFWGCFKNQPAMNGRRWT